jgi:hypothetical protein
LLKVSEVAVALPGRDLGVEVARGDLVGRVDQAPDRRDEAVGEVQAEPHRRQERDEGDQHEDRGEADLDRALQGIVGEVLGRRRAGHAGELHGELAHLPLHQQHRTVIGRHAQERGEDPPLARHEADRVARFRRVLEGRGRWKAPLLEQVDLGPGHHLGRPAHDLGHRQAQSRGPRGQEALEPGPVDVEVRSRPGQVVREDADLARQALALVLLIGVGDLDGFQHHVAHPVGEAQRQAPVNRHRRHHGEKHGRQDGDEAEEADDAGVQPCHRGVGAPGVEEDPRLPGDDHHEAEDEEDVDPEQRQPDGRRRRHPDHAGQDQEGGDGRDQGGDDHQGPDEAGAARRRAHDRGQAVGPVARLGGRVGRA